MSFIVSPTLLYKRFNDCIMTKLLIIVPKDSLLNSYLTKNFNVYTKIAYIEDRVCYKYIGLSKPMETITFLTTMFMLSDFSINCNYGDYTFLVRS